MKSFTGYKTKTKGNREMDKSNRRRKVVIITDGDNVARQAAETAAAQVGGRCISRSAGNQHLLVVMNHRYDKKNPRRSGGGNG